MLHVNKMFGGMSVFFYVVLKIIRVVIKVCFSGSIVKIKQPPVCISISANRGLLCCFIISGVRDTVRSTIRGYPATSGRTMP